jgi:hypothetical protein
MFLWGAIDPSILKEISGIRVLIAISGLIWMFYAADAFLAEDIPPEPAREDREVADTVRERAAPTPHP